MKKLDWLKKKHYTHFSPKLLDNKQIKHIRSIVKNQSYIAEHPFFPLIHKTFKERKYKKVLIKKEYKRAHKYVDDNGELICNSKERQIFYCNHLDSHIYSFYAKVVLGNQYEKKVKELGRDFSNCICAYRRHEIESTRKGKCNIHFAKDVFSYISSIDNCAILLFDIKNFFDSLNHKLLKKAWKDLFDFTELPADHYNIFKSLVNFKYVELNDIYRVLGIKSERIIKRKNIPSFFTSPDDFRKRVVYRGLIKSNPFRNNKDETIGIPQGTPISAFLANLYLLNFDKAIFNFIKSREFGLYKRYSDDIIVVCPINDIKELESFILNEIKNYELVIQETKTERFLSIKNPNGIKEILTVDKNLETISSNNPLKYLGFEYNGKYTLIKSASLSKFYRVLKTTVKAKYYWARKGVLNERKRGITNSKLHRSILYRRFSHLANSIKKRNYYNYGKNAENEMQGQLNVKIKKQLKKHFKILNETITKYERKLNIYGDNKYKKYLEKKENK